MTIIWILIEVLFIFLFYELPTVKEEQTEDKPLPQSPRHRSSSQLLSGPSPSIQKEDVPDQSLRDYSESGLRYAQSAEVQVTPSNDGGENTLFIPHTSRTASYSTNCDDQLKEAATGESHQGGSCWQEVKKAGAKLVWSISQLFREEMIVLLTILFSTTFSETTTEVVLLSLCTC